MAPVNFRNIRPALIAVSAIGIAMAGCYFFLSRRIARNDALLPRSETATGHPVKYTRRSIYKERLEKTLGSMEETNRLNPETDSRRALKTIDEINRTNRLNRENRKNTPSRVIERSGQFR